MSVTTNIHRVASIRVRATHFGVHDFVSTEFVFTTDKGEAIVISAFSKDFLQIEGSEHVNTVATAQEPS